jgi:hypothetical protein
MGVSGHRLGAARAAGLGLVLLCGASSAAVGQAAGALGLEAILQRGPNPVRSLPYFPPNALKGFRGEYRMSGQGGEGNAEAEKARAGAPASPAKPAGTPADGRILVYFTREPLVLPSSWRPAGCPGQRLLRVPTEEGFAVCHAEAGEGGYFLFFQFESEAFPWCPWIEAFLQRFRYLLPFAKDDSEIPFPAVLEMRKS